MELLLWFLVKNLAAEILFLEVTEPWRSLLLMMMMSLASVLSPEIRPSNDTCQVAVAATSSVTWILTSGSTSASGLSFGLVWKGRTCSGIKKIVAHFDFSDFSVSVVDSMLRFRQDFTKI